MEPCTLPLKKEESAFWIKATKTKRERDSCVDLNNKNEHPTTSVSRWVLMQGLVGRC